MLIFVSFFCIRGQWQQNYDYNSLYVKVYMEGIPIGRKLNILAHQSYHELVKTLEHMFDTTILCKILLLNSSLLNVL